MGWREVKNRGRQVVHKTMCVPVYYLASLDLDSNSDLPEAMEIDCRVHTQEKALGDQAGTSLNSAERFEPVPKLVFWIADLALANDGAGIGLERGNIISVAVGEAYSLDFQHPVDGPTVTWDVSRLTAEDAAGLPVR